MITLLNVDSVVVISLVYCARAILHHIIVTMFFFPQAYLLKNDENKAMSPAKLQDELNNILKFNPDFAEAVS